MTSIELASETCLRHRAWIVQSCLIRGRRLATVDCELIRIEKRIDIFDGKAYTKDQFIEYGSSSQWDNAYRVGNGRFRKSEYVVGEEVEANHMGKWYGARITAINGDNTYCRFSLLVRIIRCSEDYKDLGLPTHIHQESDIYDLFRQHRYDIRKKLKFRTYPPPGYPSHLTKC